MSKHQHDFHEQCPKSIVLNCIWHQISVAPRCTDGTNGSHQPMNWIINCKNSPWWCSAWLLQYFHITYHPGSFQVTYRTLGLKGSSTWLLRDAMSFSARWASDGRRCWSWRGCVRVWSCLGGSTTPPPPSPCPQGWTDTHKRSNGFTIKTKASLIQKAKHTNFTFTKGNKNKVFFHIQDSKISRKEIGLLLWGSRGGMKT